MTVIPVEQFGRDHWSLLAYIETRCVDHEGWLELCHLRTINSMGKPVVGGWDPKYGTSLLDKTILSDHDDLCCLDDLEAAGFVRNLGTGLYPRTQMTKLGNSVAAKIRAHKVAGGSFSSFKYER